MHRVVRLPEVRLELASVTSSLFGIGMVTVRNNLASFARRAALKGGLRARTVYDSGQEPVARPPFMTPGNFKDHMGPQPTTPLPEYDDPPVSEVVISVEFTPLANWRGPHAGLYWGRISKEYPRTEVHPPVASQIERFEEGYSPRQSMTFQMGDADSTRVWFVANPAVRLIQIQRDRFIINWRKVQGDEIYPRYEKEMRPRFEREWGHFKKFIADENLGTIEIKQCEITYVNDIVKGQGWDEFPQALALFANWLGRGSDGFLPAPETLAMNGSFLMPDHRGRLRFATMQVLRQFDNREAVQLRLVARGMPESSADSDVMNWMDFGREWIVRGFTDLTSPSAHKLWKRTR
jgi:uncharacterized protein (TIGR04255 family)